MVSALDLKLGRDLWRMRGQVLAIALVLAAATATFVLSVGVHRSLSATRDACLLYTSPSPRDRQKSRMPSSA